MIYKLLFEMPHHEYDNNVFGLVDFRIERSSKISKEEKQKLIHSFNSGVGFIGKGAITNNEWLLFTPTKISLATEKEKETIPALPEDWEEILLNIN